MYESATEHTKALVLTAPVQRFQRIAELNRQSCVGEFDHRAVPYQMVGCSKRHASIPIGQKERIYALTLESILLFVKIPRSPIGSHMRKLHSTYGYLSRWKKNLPCSTRHSHLHPCRSRIACVCIVISETGSAAPCHDTFQSICNEVPQDREKKRFQIGLVCDGSPLLLPLLLAEGGFFTQRKSLQV
jgi:hypothetical protein